MKKSSSDISYVIIKYEYQKYKATDEYPRDMEDCISSGEKN